MKNNIKNIRKYNSPYYTMATGGIIEYNKGETHENSLIGGTPVDEHGNITTINNTKPVALVEKGEISFRTPEGETVVFSNQIPVKDKGKTFADEAKSIKNKFKFRLGENNEKHDPISSNELTKQMMNLFSQQEDKKQVLGLNDDERSSQMAQQKHGGKLTQINQPTYFDLMNKLGNGGGLTEDLDKDIEKNINVPKKKVKDDSYYVSFYKDGTEIYPVMGTTEVLKNPTKYKKLVEQTKSNNTVWPDIYYTTEAPKDPNMKFAFDKYRKARFVEESGKPTQMVLNDYRLAQFTKKANGGGLPKLGFGDFLRHMVKNAATPFESLNDMVNPYDPQINPNQDEITGVAEANKYNDEVIAYLNANKVNVDPGQFNQDITGSQYTPGTYNATTYNASKYTPAKDYVAQTTTYNPITGEKIDLSQQRESVKQNMIGSRANLSSSIRNSGLSAGQQMANLLAGTTSLNTSSNQAIGESYMTEKAKNAEIANEINRFNAANKLETDRFNVGSANQASQFNIGNRNQAAQFNAQMANQAGQFNAAAANQAGQFNVGSANEASRFNVSNKLAADSSNIANRLRASMFNAQAAQDLTGQVAGLMSQKGQNVLQGRQTYNTYKAQQEEKAQNKHDEGLLGLGILGLKCGGKLPMNAYGGELGVTAIPSINFSQQDAIEQRRRQKLQDRNSKLFKIGELALSAFTGGASSPITSMLGGSKPDLSVSQGTVPEIPDYLKFKNPEYFQFGKKEEKWGGSLKPKLKLKYI